MVLDSLLSELQLRNIVLAWIVVIPHWSAVLHVLDKARGCAVEFKLWTGDSHVGGLHMATCVSSSILHAWFKANSNKQFLPFVRKDSY